MQEPNRRFAVLKIFFRYDLSIQITLNLSIESKYQRRTSQAARLRAVLVNPKISRVKFSD